MMVRLALVCSASRPTTDLTPSELLALTETKKKLLLIEDDPAVSAALMMLLRDEYDAHSAGTVRDGVRLFGTLQPCVVILDLHLPDQHGLEALRAIREIDDAARVVILTGYATLEAVEESMRLGASDCLHKPFDAKALRNRLRELTRLSARNKEDAERSDARRRAMEESLVSSAFLHDIGNPLTSMQALALLLREKSGDPETCHKLSKMIEQNLAYLGSLIEQWRAFSEPYTLKPDYGSVADIAEEAAGFVRLRAEAKGVTLKVDAEESKGLPRLNRHAVARILVNLLQNAIEAAPRVEGLVVFRARITGKEAVFDVQDNGDGIPPDDTQRIFEARYTTKRKGNGLGLFIARHIVETAKGSIAVCSRPGRGTTFSVHLPAS